MNCPECDKQHKIDSHSLLVCRSNASFSYEFQQMRWYGIECLMTEHDKQRLAEAEVRYTKFKNYLISLRK